MKEDAKLIVTKYQKGILTCILQNNRLLQANYASESTSIVGNIYIAKVLNVVPNLQAAFLEYAPGEKCYLSLQSETPMVLNRCTEGKLASGDMIAVQIIKEAIKTKEPRATSNLSVTGQYCVVTSGNTKVGFSDKLSREQKELIRPYLPKEHIYGIIVRTNVGELLEKERMQDFVQELDLLTRQMQEILDVARHRTCYSILYQAPPAYLSEIRDTYHYLYDRIVTDNPEIYEVIAAYLKEHKAEDMDKLSLYKDESYSMHKLYSLDNRIQEALQQKVWLKSGAYLVIQPTEALIAIDVNSGKNEGKKLKNDYILQINKEAAKEVVHQMKLRNLSGMILVDFINMPEYLHKDFMQYLSGLCRQDQVPTKVVDMTALGLVEITRKKIRKSLWEQFHQM